MDIRGRVQNGVVVVEGGLMLPEGTEVTILCPAASQPESSAQRRVSLPLVPSMQPGRRMLTAERVAELLEEDDASFRS
jgi:hypothetical protein